MGLPGRSMGQVCLVIMAATAFAIPGRPWMSMPLASPVTSILPMTVTPSHSTQANVPPMLDVAQRRSELNSQLESLQPELDDGTLVVAFLVGPGGTDAFLVNDEGIDIKTLSMDRGRLEEAVDSWVSYIQNATHPETVFFNKFESLAEYLYAELLRPLEGSIDASERLVLIPDGPLHRLPFSCLKRSAGRESGQYLVQWKPFQTAPSVGDYRRVLASGGAALHGGSQLAAFGDADFGALLDPHASREDASSMVEPFRYRSLSGLASLPGSGDEVRSIAHVFPRHRLFLGKDATKDQLKALAQVDVLHVSTHGVRSSPQSGEAALLLSPKRLDGRPVLGSERLEMSEILRGEVPSAKLVVLSACDSALGDRPESAWGDGRGLGWAFLATGSRSVVGSLWKVDDLHTVTLMHRFYHHLGTGMPQGEALQRAQVDLITGQDAASKAPRVWAAFQMQGHWR